MRGAHTRLLLAAALLAALGGVSPGAMARADGGAKPAEFADVVELIEAHFRVKHKGLPALAKLPLKIDGRFRRFAEIGSLKLATFDDQDFSAPGDAVWGGWRRWKFSAKPATSLRTRARWSLMSCRRCR